MTSGNDAGADASPPTDAQSDGAALDAPMSDAGMTCTAQQVALTFDNCPAMPTCGGTIAAGIYDYSAACFSDLWGMFQGGCPALQVTSQTGTMQGCATFAGGNLTQSLMIDYAATVDIPMSCLSSSFNVSSCMQLQSELAPAFFDTATCSTNQTGCTCSITASFGSTGTVGYSTSNDQIVTSTNNHYDYCVQGSSLTTQWASGPNTMAGVYTATMQ